MTNRMLGHSRGPELADCCAIELPTNLRRRATTHRDNADSTPGRQNPVSPSITVGNPKRLVTENSASHRNPAQWPTGTEPSCAS